MLILCQRSLPPVSVQAVFTELFTHTAVHADGFPQKPAIGCCIAVNLVVDIIAHIHCRRTIAEKGIKQSMSRKGNCYDNSVMKNFLGHPKSKLLYLQEFESVDRFKQELIEYIDCYNNRRIKTRLKGLPPALHRQQALLAA